MNVQNSGTIQVVVNVQRMMRTIIIKRMAVAIRILVKDIAEGTRRVMITSQVEGTNLSLHMRNVLFLDMISSVMDEQSVS